MNGKDDVIKKHREKIKTLSEELANELLKTEPDLIKRFTSFDSDVQKILIEIGNTTMGIIGSTLEQSVKKKPEKKD